MSKEYLTKNKWKRIRDNITKKRSMNLKWQLYDSETKWKEWSRINGGRKIKSKNWLEGGDNKEPRKEIN